MTAARRESMSGRKVGGRRGTLTRVALAKAIAVECAQYNIRANCVSPGPADTQQSVDLTSLELMNKWRAEGFPVVPLNRLASVDDIAHAVAKPVPPNLKHFGNPIELFEVGVLRTAAQDVVDV